MYKSSNFFRREQTHVHIKKKIRLSTAGTPNELYRMWLKLLLCKTLKRQFLLVHKSEAMLQNVGRPCSPRHMLSLKCKELLRALVEALRCLQIRIL